MEFSRRRIGRLLRHGLESLLHRISGAQRGRDEVQGVRKLVLESPALLRRDCGDGSGRDRRSEQPEDDCGQQVAGDDEADQTRDEREAEGKGDALARAKGEIGLLQRGLDLSQHTATLGDPLRLDDEPAQEPEPGQQALLDLSTGVGTESRFQIAFHRLRAEQEAADQEERNAAAENGEQRKPAGGRTDGFGRHHRGDHFVHRRRACMASGSKSSAASAMPFCSRFSENRGLNPVAFSLPR